MPVSKSIPAPSVPPQNQVAGTAAFSKFMHVLQLVADADGPVNVASLMRASGYPRPTVHRIVAALIAEGLLGENERGATLALGPRLIQLASRSWGRSELRSAAVDELKQLRDITGETVHLAVPSGRNMVFIEKLESTSAVCMSSRIGTTVSLHSTAVGKAYLAALDDADCAAVLAGLPSPLPRHTEHTTVEPAALKAEIAQTRRDGWATDNEENEPGVHCFGAAIVNAQGRPVAAISVSTLLFRQKPDPQAAYVKPLLEACRIISARIAQAPSLSDGQAL